MRYNYLSQREITLFFPIIKARKDRKNPRTNS